MSDYFQDLVERANLNAARDHVLSMPEGIARDQAILDVLKRMNQLNLRMEPDEAELDGETVVDLDAIDDDPSPAFPSPLATSSSTAIPARSSGLSAPWFGNTHIDLTPNQQAPLFPDNPGVKAKSKNKEIFRTATPKNLDIVTLLRGREITIGEMMTVR